MARILLVKPPIYEVEPELPPNLSILEEARTGFYSFASQPSGLLRIGSYLKAQGNDVIYVDCSAEVESEYNFSILRKRFVTNRQVGNTDTRFPVYHYGMSYENIEKEFRNLGDFDEVYVSSCMTYHWEPVHETIKICKKMFPNARIKLGGIYATICKEHAKKTGVEVIDGEIEEANDQWIDMSLFRYNPPYIVLKSTRGCPNNCSYCSVPKIEGRCMRYRDPKDIVDEISTLNRIHGIREFHFWESNLLVNSKNHFEIILDMIIERGLDIRFSTPEGLQPSLITEALARKMRIAGMMNVNLPLETIDDDMSKNRFKRSSHLKSFIDSVEHMKAAGLKNDQIKVFILAGMPNQSIESILNSIILVMELGLKIKIMPFTPIPGTEEYENYKNIIEDKGLEDLHPFLFPFAGRDFTVDDMVHICAFSNFLMDPFTTLKLLPDTSKIKQRLSQKVKESTILMERLNEHDSINAPWDNNGVPDNTIIKAYRDGFLTDEETILDIGCGNGKNLRWLSEKGCDVFGIDVSKQAIESLGSNTICKDFLEWVPDRKFDCAIDIGCFHMIEAYKQRQYFKHVAMSLKDGGKYLLRLFSEHGMYVKRYYPLSLQAVNKSPWIEYSNITKIKTLLSEYFHIIDISELMWSVVGDEMKPGMYELRLIKK